MLDCQLFGMNAAGHHVTSLLWHEANSLLLLLVLVRMTRRLWPSVFVAILFAVHPLRVESVAWVAERKDVLSTFFWLLAMVAYVRYVKSPSRWRYVLVATPFALGLMAKPMVVTLPLVLLLLDFWPLGRLTAASSWRGTLENVWAKVKEKIPLLALSVVSGIITIWTQRSAGAVGGLDKYPLGVRLANAAVTYVRYLIDMLWPRGLAILYPHPGSSIPGWEVAGSCAVIALISVLAFRSRRRHPYLIVGWAWYVLTALPVIGLVQAGAQARADRYTYVPLIGIFMAVAWGIPDLLLGSDGPRWARLSSPRPKVLLGAAGSVLTVVLVACTWTQVGYWRDSMTVWEHAVKVTDGPYRAHNNLGVLLWEKRNGDEAVTQFREAFRIKPDFANAYCNLANVLFMRGSYDEARREIEKCKVYGGTPNPQVLRELQSRMPEPKGRPGR